ETFFSECRDHLANLVDARTSEPRGDRLTACRVHAHIERTVGPEAEAARRIVELRRGDAEVEQNTPAVAAARVCRHQRADVGKRRMHERKPHFVGKALTAGRDGLRVAVDREHAAFSTQGLEKECRMTAAPERRIDIVTVRLGSQRPEHLICEHRDVLVHTPGSYNDSESSCDDRSVAASSLFNQSSRCSHQRDSFHSSKRLPWPINMPCRSRPANSRSSGGSRMRPCPSSSRSLACPTMRRCSRRACECKVGRLISLLSISCQSGSG